jgi:hypothetical protein
MKFLWILIFLIGCSTTKPPSDLVVDLTIEEVRADKGSALTKQNLIHLSQVYHLEPFLYTKRIRIESKGKVQSHPVLTLNTIHAEHPHKLLGQWLHQEFYWYLKLQDKAFQKSLTSFKKNFPGKTKQDYTELAVSFLEYESLIHFLEKKEAHRVIKGNTWAYREALSRSKLLKKILKAYGIFPDALH